MGFFRIDSLERAMSTLVGKLGRAVLVYVLSSIGLVTLYQLMHACMCALAAYDIDIT